MKAERTPDARVRLIVTPQYEITPPAYVEFKHLLGFLSEAKEGLWRKRDEFPVRVSITFEESQSLMDEMLLIRYDLLGTARPYDPATDRFDGGTREVRKTSTAWDKLPKIEAEILSDRRLALTLGRGELAIFANCVDVAIESVGAKRSEVGRDEFWIRRSMAPEDAEAFRDELRRLDREARDEAGRGSAEG